MKAPSLVPLTDTEFREIEEELRSYPRQCGYYLTRLASISGLRQQELSQEALLAVLCQAWADHEALHAAARERGYPLEPPEDAR